MRLGHDFTDQERIQLILFIVKNLYITLESMLNKILFQAKKIFVNVPSTHNTPLETGYFKLPWNPKSSG